MEKGGCKYPQLLDKEWIHHKYWVLEDSLSEIGEDIGCNAQTILNWMRYHGIPTRDYHESHKGHLSGNYMQSERFEGEKNPFYGKHHTEEAKEKDRKAHTGIYDGENNPFYGKKHSEETIERIIETRNSEQFKRSLKATIHSKEYREKMRKKWDTKEFKQQMRDIGACQKHKTHHTKPELIFMDICKRNGIDFHFVGDKSLWIGDKVKLNPDFIEANGKKICVEVMGDYWHSPLLNPKVDKIRTLPYREKHFKKYGWVPIFIWGNDLTREDAEQFVLSTLKREGVMG